MKVTEDTKRLAREILEYLSDHPERHDQGDWFSVEPEDVPKLSQSSLCDTTMCVAGTAVFLSSPFEEFKSRLADESINWETEGAELLGLTFDESDMLFYAGNEAALQMLRAVAEGDEDAFREAYML